MSKRVMISGCSGVGKSTLAEHIAKTYNIPFITTSTKPLWPKYNINSHEELIKMVNQDTEFGINFQFELLEYREKMIKENKSFVTDRSPLDNMVYFLAQNSFAAGEQRTRDYIERCVRLTREGTHFIYIRLTPDIKFEDDGMRVNNLHYQLAMDAIFKNCINVYLVPDFHVRGKKLLEISGWDWETRCRHVAKYLTNLVILGS